MADTRISAYQRACLRLAAFTALKGWGSTREGRWQPWNWIETAARADELVTWSLSGASPEGHDGSPLPMPPEGS